MMTQTEDPLDTPRADLVDEGTRAVADAVLFEGYALFPYRADALKNRQRFQFGVLLPRPEERPGGGAGAAIEPWWSELVCLVEPGPSAAALRIVLRFLRLRRRRVETPAGQPVRELEVDGRLLVGWDEAEVAEVVLAHRLGEPAAPRPFHLPGDEEREQVRDRAGALVAQVVRTRSPVSGRVLVDSELATVARPLRRLRVRVENTAESLSARAPREEVLPHALIATHLILQAGDGAAFVSAIDPPPWARAASSACRNTGLFPVLGGDEGRRDVLIAAPIILYDHPRLAAPSRGDLFDGAEIDELLTLSTLHLTDEEKRRARATDERVARLLDRVEATTAEELSRMHGGIAAEPCRPGSTSLLPGRRVRLRPRASRRGDPQDAFLAGRTAVVRAIEHDLEDRPLLAVALDEPGAPDLPEAPGSSNGRGPRLHFFALDEVEPCDTPGADHALRAGDGGAS